MALPERRRIVRPTVATMSEEELLDFNNRLKTTREEQRKKDAEAYWRKVNGEIKADNRSDIQRWWDGLTYDYARGTENNEIINALATFTPYSIVHTILSGERPGAVDYASILPFGAAAKVTRTAKKFDKATDISKVIDEMVEAADKITDPKLRKVANKEIELYRAALTRKKGIEATNAAVQNASTAQQVATKAPWIAYPITRGLPRLIGKEGITKGFWSTPLSSVMQWGVAVPIGGSWILKGGIEGAKWTYNNLMPTFRTPDNSSTEIDREGTEQAWKDMKVGRKPGQ